MSIVFMKALETQPSRYDKGISMLTVGRIHRLYEEAIVEISDGDKVLDLGCGTGNLTLRAAARGAKVKGIDVNPEMLAILRKKARKKGLSDRIELEEKGIAELDSEPEGYYDIITSGLLFSELSPLEIKYCLDQCFRIIKPNGRMLIIDEIVPKSFWKRIMITSIRIPLLILTYLLTQTSTRMLSNLEENITNQGFVIEKEKRVLFDSLVLLVARKQG